MKKTLILGLSLLVLNISHARDLCPNLLVTEASKSINTIKHLELKDLLNQVSAKPLF